jgi:hypothetical protein
MPSQLSTGLWSTDAARKTTHSASSSGGYLFPPSDNQESVDSHERVGILSRTLVRSPAVQWIIPARIRHKDKNDTLFIGGDYVQIRQLLAHNQFYDIATKADFGSPIRAVRVFGSEKRSAVDILEQIVKQESQDDLERMDIDGIHHQVLPPEILALTLESQKLVFLFATEGPSSKINWVCRTRELPAVDSYPHLYGKHLAVDPK